MELGVRVHTLKRVLDHVPNKMIEVFCEHCHVQNPQCAPQMGSQELQSPTQLASVPTTPGPRQPLPSTATTRPLSRSATPMLILVRPSPDTGQAKRETRISVTRRFSTASSSQTSSQADRRTVNRPDGRSINNCRDHHALTRVIPLIHLSCFIQI
jgi:hypothetical protein